MKLAAMTKCLLAGSGRDPNVEILYHTEVRELLADGELRGVVAEDNQTGQRRTLEARALFVFIGADPQIRGLADQLVLDDDGFVLTGTVVAAPEAAAWPPGRARFPA